MDDRVASLYLHALATATDASVVACDADGVITLASAAVRRLMAADPTGLSEAEVLARFPLLHEDGRTPLAPEEGPLRRARLGERVAEEVYSYDHEVLGLLYLRTTAGPVVDERGSVIGAVQTLKDVTGERLARREQAGLQRRLFTMVNHEFRTPLAGMLGHAELLALRAEELPASVRESVDAISRAVWRMRDLLRGVSEVLQVESEGHAETVPLDLAEVVAAEVAARHAAAGERGVALALERHGEAVVLGDRSKLVRAVAAMIENALEHAPPSTQVRVSVGGDVKVAWAEVVDAGPAVGDLHDDQPVGVDPLALPASRGVQLSLTRIVAIAHGGDLELGEAGPRGLRARLRLPLYRQAGTP